MEIDFGKIIFRIISFTSDGTFLPHVNYWIVNIMFIHHVHGLYKKNINKHKKYVLIQLYEHTKPSINS